MTPKQMREMAVSVMAAASNAMKSAGHLNNVTQELRQKREDCSEILITARMMSARVHAQRFLLALQDAERQFAENSAGSAPAPE